MMLMRLITYCYASGVHDSESISTALQPPEEPDYLDSQKVPDANMIRRFRRLHRPGIEECLATVLEAVAHVDCCKWSTCGERPSMRMLYVCEARERIEHAMRLDMIDNDL